MFLWLLDSFGYYSCPVLNADKLYSKGRPINHRMPSLSKPCDAKRRSSGQIFLSYLHNYISVYLHRKLHKMDRKTLLICFLSAKFSGLYIMLFIKQNYVPVVVRSICIFAFAVLCLNYIYSDKVHDTYIQMCNIKIIGADSKAVAY